MSQHTLKVLVVEDEMLISRILEKYLGTIDCTVAGSTIFGEEALALCRSTRPDVVLMDIRLAGKMNGLDAARTILEEFSLPLIFMSAFGTDEVEAIVSTIPHAAFLQKPIIREQLKVVMEQIRTQWGFAPDENISTIPG